jgi:glycosyltransferase involved in cell wall biosynthesis
MIKLSILVASKNQSRFIPDLLSSLDRQTFQDFELVIVDSFSSDGSIDLFKSYKKTRLFLKDCNVNDAYRFALKNARGKYVMLATTSDYLYSPKWLENAIKNLELDSTLSLVWGSAVNISESGVLRGVWGEHFLHNHPPSRFNYLPYWLFNPYLPELNFVVRREVYQHCLAKQVNLDYMYIFMLNFTKCGFLQKYIPDLAHAGRSHIGSLTLKNRFHDYNQFHILLRKNQLIYFFQIILGIKKHIFRDAKMRKIKDLSTIQKALMPIIVLKILLTEFPKALFRKIVRLVKLRRD